MLLSFIKNVSSWSGFEGRQFKDCTVVVCFLSMNIRSKLQTRLDYVGKKKLVNVNPLTNTNKEMDKKSVIFH